MLLINTVAVQIRIPDNIRRIGPSIASSNPNWEMPSISKVIFGGSELLKPSSGDPTIAKGYGPLETSKPSTSKPNTE